MKKFSTLSAFCATLALVVSGQICAKEVEVLESVELKNTTVNEVNALSSPKEKGRDYLAYVSVGLSAYQRDIDSTVGKGSQFRIAWGIQYNQLFTLECYVQRTPAIAPQAVLDDLEQSIDLRILSSSISTRGNRYNGILGKFSHALRPDVSLFAKVGVARYEAHQINGRLTLDDPSDNVRFRYLILEGGTDGYSPVVSIGYETPIPYQDSKKTSGEVSLTQMFDDKVKNLSLNATLKYTF